MGKRSNAGSTNERKKAAREAWPLSAPSSLAEAPTFATLGTRADTINVSLSYRIVDLFSENLYTSPHKAMEELVTNAFDAGAQRVAVLLAANLSVQGATIAVVDDGEGMDIEGLRAHWLIGESGKRDRVDLPLNRAQIGKFGIGKLATYVLANRLSHVCRVGKEFFSTSMNYRLLDPAAGGVQPGKSVGIDVRRLTEEQAKQALAPWTAVRGFKDSGLELFGKRERSWTVAILSELKPKAEEIERGTLRWVLSTALPLRDDFKVWFDGGQLVPAKTGKGLLRRWILGKDIQTLGSPAPDGIELAIDDDVPKADPKRYGLSHSALGRFTGTMEVYKDPINLGKSTGISRSEGVFVYVRGRLINLRDGHFGIKPNELKLGAFNRFRLVLHIDKLDAALRANREMVSEGALLIDVQNTIRALFNVARVELDKHDLGEDPGAALARRLAETPTSLVRRPIIEMVRCSLEGRRTSRYVTVPTGLSPDAQAELLKDLEERCESRERFIAGVTFSYDGNRDDGIATYDAPTGELQINGLHPFVGAFFDEFQSRTAGLPLEVFAMAEVLLEAHLYELGLTADQVAALLTTRDRVLRHVAQESGLRTPLAIAAALVESRNNWSNLEKEVVAAFRSLGFLAGSVSNAGKPDGVARAVLGADAQKRGRSYSLSLEAKSTRQDGRTIATATVNVSTISRHRKQWNCQHAVVVGPRFASSKPGSALEAELLNDKETSAKLGENRTITCLRIDDLARLVRLAPAKGLTLTPLRELFKTCCMPQDATKWIDDLAARPTPKPPYRKILEAIYTLQARFPGQPVKYAALVVTLDNLTPPLHYADDQELIEQCKAMANMSQGLVIADNSIVELDSSVDNALAKIEQATKDHLAG